MRPQDEVDIRTLLRVCDEVELELAKRATDLIRQRGFSRGRNLGEALDEFLAEADR